MRKLFLQFTCKKYFSSIYLLNIGTILFHYILYNHERKKTYKKEVKSSLYKYYNISVIKQIISNFSFFVISFDMKY